LTNLRDSLQILLTVGTMGTLAAYIAGAPDRVVLGGLVILTALIVLALKLAPPPRGPREG
jgi:hypothetical protein